MKQIVHFATTCMLVVVLLSCAKEPIANDIKEPQVFTMTMGLEVLAGDSEADTRCWYSRLEACEEYPSSVIYFASCEKGTNNHWRYSRLRVVTLEDGSKGVQFRVVVGADGIEMFDDGPGQGGLYIYQSGEEAMLCSGNMGYIRAYSQEVYEGGEVDYAGNALHYYDGDVMFYKSEKFTITYTDEELAVLGQKIKPGESGRTFSIELENQSGALIPQIVFFKTSESDEFCHPVSRSEMEAQIGGKTKVSPYLYNYPSDYSLPEYELSVYPSRVNFSMSREPLSIVEGVVLDNLDPRYWGVTSATSCASIYDGYCPFIPADKFQNSSVRFAVTGTRGMWVFEAKLEGELKKNEQKTVRLFVNIDDLTEESEYYYIPWYMREDDEIGSVSQEVVFVDDIKTRASLPSVFYTIE